MTGQRGGPVEENPFLRTPGMAARETLLYLDRNAIDADPVLAEAGLSRSQLSQRDIGVSVASQYRFFELAAAAAEDGLIGLHIAATMEMRNAGVSYYLVASSATVAEALHDLARYSHIASGAVLFELTAHGQGAVLAAVPVRHYAGLRRQYCEFVAFLVVRVLRAVTGSNCSASKATFAHAAGEHSREVAELLGCPVEFGRAEDSLLFLHSALELAIVSSDTQLLEILRAHADNLLLERRSTTELRRVVERELVRLLPGGRAQCAIVAQQLGMSPRSFTRHLAEEHTTFSQILDNLRKQLALRYLTDARISLQQVAWLLGYSEMAAFDHAFKRWTGTSPSRMRRQPFALASQ